MALPSGEPSGAPTSEPSAPGPVPSEPPPSSEPSAPVVTETVTAPADVSATCGVAELPPCIVDVTPEAWLFLGVWGAGILLLLAALVASRWLP